MGLYAVYSKGKKENSVIGWGDRQATIDYCKLNLPASVKNLEGDMKTSLYAAFPGVRSPAVTLGWRMTKLLPSF